ncbi:MAG: EAL domain-containing protein, partial [Burkholderiaceae bacterium]
PAGRFFVGLSARRVRCQGVKGKLRFRGAVWLVADQVGSRCQGRKNETLAGVSSLFLGAALRAWLPFQWRHGATVEGLRRAPLVGFGEVECLMWRERFRRIRGSVRLVAVPAVQATVLGVFLAAVLMVLDVYRDLDRDLDFTQARTQKALVDIESMIQAVAPQVEDKRCDDVIETLRQYAAFDHRVRSLALVEGDRVSCTSLFPQDEYRLSDVVAPELPIRLLAGTPRWPQAPALTMHYGEGGRGVLAFISGREFISAVPDFGPGTTRLHVGAATLLLGNAAAQSDTSPVWMSFARAVRPGVRVERFVTQHQMFRRLADVWPLLLGLVVLVVVLIAGFYAQAYRRGGILTNQLRIALAQRQFVPYYQPVVTSEPGFPVAGFEVLMRWNKPGEGVVAPADFLPTAERTGLLLRMTEALMTRVIADVNTGTLMHGRIVGVNLAAGHLRDPDKMIALAQRFLAKTEGTGTRLTLEVSEQSIRTDLLACEPTLQKIKAMGVFLSVDDFCTSNANLDTLCAMRFDYVKCDRFVAGLIDCGDQREVLPAAVIELIHRLGFSLVAEGVETVAQADFFVGCGVSYMQGFYFGRPMPYAELAAWMAQHEARFAPLGAMASAKPAAADGPAPG